MTMTVRDLIRELEVQEPDAEVRLMSQPSWPFEYSIDGVWLPPERKHGGTSCLKSPDYDLEEEDGDPCAACDTDGFEPEDPPEAGVVYLTEGTQLAYGTKDAWS